LTPEQREDRGTSYHDIIAMADADKIFFNKIIMGDEILSFVYDPKTKRQTSEWVGETSPRPKKLKFQRSRIKTERKTVNAEFYKGVMDRLLKHIQRVPPPAFCCRHFFLLHENAPAHKTESLCQFLTPKNVTTLYHPRTLKIYLRQTIFSSPTKFLKT
jgi:hypothetical protein